MSDATSHVHWLRWSVTLSEASGGRPLCLSLANTLHWRNTASPRETLRSYADVVQWAVATSIVAAKDADALEREADAHPHVASAELLRTIALREAIAAVFAARAHGRSAPERDLDSVMRDFSEASRHLVLDVVDGRLVPGMPAGRQGLELPRWQAALSAVGLYTSDAIPRVKQCADDRGCGWLFLDTTRNVSRLFCFSSECGNRARQAKFRARKREGAPASGAE